MNYIKVILTLLLSQVLTAGHDKLTHKKVLAGFIHVKEIQEIICDYLDSFTPAGTLDLGKSPLEAVLFFDDFFVAMNERGTITTWHAKNNDIICNKRIEGLKKPCKLDNNSFAVLCANEPFRYLRIYKFDGTLLSYFMLPTEANYKEIACMRAQDPQNNLIALINQNKIIVIRPFDHSDSVIRPFDQSDSDELEQFQNKIVYELNGQRIQCCTASPVGDRIAFGNVNNGVKIWHMKPNTIIKTAVEENYTPLAVAFSPNGKIVAALCIYSYLLYDAHTLKKIFSGDINQDGIKNVEFCYSPVGNILAILRNNPRAHKYFIDIINDTQKVVQTLAIPQELDRATIAFSPDGAWLCAACSNGSLIKWQNKARIQNNEKEIPEIKESKTESGCVIC